MHFPKAVPCCLDILTPPKTTQPHLTELFLFVCLAIWYLFKCPFKNDVFIPSFLDVLIFNAVEGTMHSEGNKDRFCCKEKDAKIS